jgi:nicotinate-nucleotide pyrophosphorylase (carboxylating)
MDRIPLTNHQILHFLNEDGVDKTTLSIPSIVHKECQFKFISKQKEDFIFCGEEVMSLILNTISNTNFKIQNLKKDGDIVCYEETILEGTANIANFLLAERTALNLIQQLSAISTNARILKNALNSQSIKLLDTRKTTPGLRMLQKYAAKCGGAVNHRFGLGDLIMIKDNHIYAAGGIKNAICEAIKSNNNNLEIEVECETLEDVKEAIKHKIQYIMLDNMSIEVIEQAVAIIKTTNIKIEVSGGVNLENISNFSKLDIDFISCGAITHSIKSIDISAKITI